MTTLDKIRRAVAVRIPGTHANCARQKRLLERELRTQGFSRSHAVAEVSRRFKEGKHA